MWSCRALCDSADRQRERPLLDSALKLGGGRVQDERRAARADLHVNGDISNRCVGGGFTSSPAGIAPTTDFDDQTRTGVFDIGADEL